MNRSTKIARIAIVVLVMFFVLSAFAAPVAAEKGGKGGGGGGGGGGGSGGGGGGGGGGSGGGGGNGGGGGSDGDGSSGSNGQGDERSSDNPSQEHREEHAPAEQAADQAHENNQAATGGDASGGDGEGGDVVDDGASEPAFDSSSDGSSDGGSTTMTGWVGEAVESTGSAVKAITSRDDMAELLNTDADSPIVGFFMIMLTAGVIAGLYGTVQVGKTGTESLVTQARKAKDAKEVAMHMAAADAAGLPAKKWAELEASTYRQLLRTDAHTVAFWMGSDLAAVRRWQAGRTLAQDIADGLVIPDDVAEDASWRMPGTRWSKAPTPTNVDVQPEPVSPVPAK